MSETRWEADDSDTRELWAVPGALAIALVFSFLPPVRFLFEASVCMELHELGHALASWLGGVFAIPLPMITLSFSSARSMLVFLPLVLLFLWVRWALLKEDCDGLARVIGVLLAAQLVLTLLVSEETLRGIVLASGQGGELALGATLCALFHVRFPRVTRWPSSRWFFLGCGAVSYVFAMRKWLRARADPDAVPWGSFWGGDGDMEHVQAMGVSTEQLVSIYLWIAALSGLVLAVVWLASWRRARA